MKLFPPAPEPAEFGTGAGVVFWYGAPHIARAVSSRRYRLENRLAHLPDAVSWVGRELPDELVERARIVVAVRPFPDRPFQRTLARLRARGCSIWADYDDLLFAVELDELPNARRFWDRLRWRRRLPVYARGLRHFDAFTCTTEPIAAALQSARPDAAVHLVPNVPSSRWIEDGWARFGHRAWKPGDPLRLGYFPGSPSHDEDFATIEDTLVRLLAREPRLELTIAGYLRFGRERFPAAQLHVSPPVPIGEFPELLLATWINLVPLVDTPFSRARSNIKVLEAEAFGVPSITRDFESELYRALERGR